MGVSRYLNKNNNVRFVAAKTINRHKFHLGNYSYEDYADLALQAAEDIIADTGILTIDDCHVIQRRFGRQDKAKALKNRDPKIGIRLLSNTDWPTYQISRKVMGNPKHIHICNTYNYDLALEVNAKVNSIIADTGTLSQDTIDEFRKYVKSHVDNVPNTYGFKSAILKNGQVRKYKRSRAKNIYEKVGRDGNTYFNVVINYNHNRVEVGTWRTHELAREAVRLSKNFIRRHQYFSQEVANEINANLRSSELNKKLSNLIIDRDSIDRWVKLDITTSSKFGYVYLSQTHYRRILNDGKKIAIHHDGNRPSVYNKSLVTILYGYSAFHVKYLNGDKFDLRPENIQVKSKFRSQYKPTDNIYLPSNDSLALLKHHVKNK